MAPILTRRRAISSSLPTLLSISKLFQASVSAVSAPYRQTKRDDYPFTTFHEHHSHHDANNNTISRPIIDPEDPIGSPVFWWKLGFSICLVLMGGVFAGLTLALMGSDDLNLRVLATSSDDAKERKAARKVLKLLERGRHWVLVVLLLGNVIVNESLPIFLDDVLGGGVAAVIVSTTMIVIFGEIIPQAVCVRYGLAIGGACAPLVYGCMILFSPIAYPVAKLLDKVLGSEKGHTYKKAELKSFLQFHKQGEEPLRDDEIGILNGVLSLNEKHAKEIMTPIKDCLTLSADMVLDHEAIDQILLSGFSRLPVHEPEQPLNFIGMLLVKRLISYNPDESWPVSKFPLLPLPEAKPDINCFQALDYFQTGRAHLLLISDNPGSTGGALGIVSLEDLIEEIIGEEIIDETDRYQDNHSKKSAKRSGTAAVMRGIIERRRNQPINLSRAPSMQRTQSPITLAPPRGTNDGLLIQIENGNIVAEPVSIPPDENPSGDGRRLVVGQGLADGMERIQEDGEDATPVYPSREVQVKSADDDRESARNIRDLAAEEDGEGNGKGDHAGDSEDQKPTE